MKVFPSRTPCPQYGLAIDALAQTARCYPNCLHQMGPQPGLGNIAALRVHPVGLRPRRSTTNPVIMHPLPVAARTRIQAQGWADSDLVIYRGLRNSDPRIRKRPKLDQQSSNCHMRSAGRPSSEEAGPKPLHTAHATLSCWNPAGGPGVQAQQGSHKLRPTIKCCTFPPCELGVAACAHPVCRRRSQGTLPAYNLG